METNILKEQILESKLNLYRIQIEKNTAVKYQLFEKASHLRDQEKQTKEHLGNLKREVLRLIEKSKNDREDINYYAELQSLVFEFDPIEFLNEYKQVQSIDTIDKYVRKYWEKRDQMRDDLMKYLFEEYNYLREQIQQFKGDSDEVNAQKALRRLASISDLIHRHKP